MSTTAHYMLSASALHDLAPGILGVVHGPDGEHEGAPVWRGPLYGPAYGYTPGWWYFEGFDDDGDFLLLGDAGAAPDMLSYDLRVEGVRARFVRLCERAMGTGSLFEQDEFGGAHLRCGDEVIARWDRDGNPVEAHPFGPVHFPHIGRDWLAPLVMALAPRIAALGGA